MRLTKQMVVVEQPTIHENQQVEKVALFLPDGSPYEGGVVQDSPPSFETIFNAGPPIAGNQNQRFGIWWDDDVPTLGSYTLTFRGDTTPPIAFDAELATVLAALEALPSIGVGNIQWYTLGGTSLSNGDDEIDFEFIGDLGAQDVESPVVGNDTTDGGIQAATWGPTAHAQTAGRPGQHYRDTDTDNLYECMSEDEDGNLSWDLVVKTVNGENGDVTIAFPVTSVNGLNGDIVISPGRSGIDLKTVAEAARIPASGLRCCIDADDSDSYELNGDGNVITLYPSASMKCSGTGPTIDPESLNGRDTFLFDGTQYLTFQSAADLGFLHNLPFTFIAVVKYDVMNVVGQVITFLGNHGYSGGGGKTFAFHAGDGGVDFYLSGGAVLNIRSNTPIHEWVLVTVTTDPSNATPADRGKLYFDGVDTGAINTYGTVDPDTDANFDSPLRFGSSQSGYSPNLIGSIAQMLIWDRPLSAEEQLQAESYVRNKWFASMLQPNLAHATDPASTMARVNSLIDQMQALRLQENS